MTALMRNIFRLICVTGLAYSGFIYAAETPDQNAIEAIDVATLEGGHTVLKITLKQPLENAPASFSINNPPRVAFDFPNTTNSIGKNSLDLKEGSLRGVKIVQAGQRTRLVVNLATNVGYDTELKGNQFFITLQSGSAVASNKPGGDITSHFAEAKTGEQKHSVVDIDFRRGADGSGKIVVELSDNTTGIDLRQQGKTIVIELIKTTLPSNLSRRLDVTDFATPVRFVDAAAEGDNTRIVVEPKGLWEHSAYQTNNRFVLEVKPIVEDPNKLVQGEKVGYKGEKLSLNFQNVEVRSVLQVIADFTGLNIITSDTVTGNLTLRLKDVPWDQALDIILQSKGLDLRKNGNVVWIAPRDELATKEKLALEAKQQIAELEPTHTETFQLNYQKAEAFKNILTDPAQKILSKRGSAVIDPRTNTLFIQDTAAKLDEIRRLIKQIDVPVRQVMIEARIVEASDNFTRNLGVRLGLHDRSSGNGLISKGSNIRQVMGANLNDTTFHTGQIVDPVPTLNDFTNVNLPSAGIGGISPGVFSVVLFNQGLTRFLNLEISALQADAKGKIISSPRVITADQSEATIEQGVEIPFQQATSSGATSVAFKKATLSLKVKPQITPDDKIIMNLDIHKDSQGDDTTAGPAINTKQITTEVLVENGGTVVIGGIYEQTQTDTTRKIPVLGDLPYFGFLFKQKSKVDNKTELLIFITPKILSESLGLR
jgi:type IV pilus assembly protein PilQ